MDDECLRLSSRLGADDLRGEAKQDCGDQRMSDIRTGMMVVHKYLPSHKSYTEALPVRCYDLTPRSFPVCDEKFEPLRAVKQARRASNQCALRAAAFHFDDAMDLAVRPISKSERKIADLFTKLQSLFEDVTFGARLGAARPAAMRHR